jgi:hypothetical protein
VNGSTIILYRVFLFIILLSGVATTGFAASSALVCDTGNNVVRAYSVAGTNWTYTGDFASGQYDGQPLTMPMSVAQDAAENIYLCESSTNGRVLEFDTNGVYLGCLGTNGVDFSGGNPQALAIGPDGNLYMSLAFITTSGNCIYRYDFGSRAWTVFVPNNDGSYSLNNPRGLAFASDGNLYVADRQNNKIRVFNGATGAFIKNISANFPQGLSWDTANNRLLATINSSSDVYAYTLSGAGTMLYKGSEYCLDVQPVEGRVAFTRYSSGQLDLVSATNEALSAATFLKNPGHFEVVTLGPREPVTPPGCPTLPGTAIKYSPASTSIYLGSPAIVILTNGDYLTSHDYFGGGSTEASLGQTFLYRSSDRGTNWSYLGQINQLVSGTADNDGCFWNHFIQLNGNLYSIANSSDSGGMVIRQALNNDSEWTYVNGSPDNTGRLFVGQVWRPGQSYTIKDGCIWLEADANINSAWANNYMAAMFAPTNANLLNPSSWSLSLNKIAVNQNWLNGTFRGWLEGNCLLDTNGNVVLVVRVDNRYTNGAAIGGKAAVIRVKYSGGTNATVSFDGGTFDPSDPNSSGFIDFPGGCTRFTIRWDPVSREYWTLCNYTPRAFRNNAYNNERFRGVLALASSPDLANWTVQRIVMADWRLYSSDPTIVASAFNGNETAYGFQYADWQFDGDDIVATVRTGFCDEYGGSNSGHNANYYLFRRAENFRANPGNIRISDLQLQTTNHAAQITFTTRPARMYGMQSSTDLINWKDVGQSLEGDGNPASFTVTNQISSSCFYRITEGTSWMP